MAGSGGAGSREDLLRRLSGRDLAWVLRKVRARLDAGEPLSRPATLPAPTASQRAAAAELTGRRPGPGTLVVRLEPLDDVARALGFRDGLAGVVAALDGTEPAAEPEPEPEPVAEDVVVLPPTALRPTAPTTADSRARAWERAWAPLEHLPTSPVDWSSWWRAELATGDLGALVASPAHAAVLAPQLAEVLGFLPAGSELLADLAEAVTGSATGLDGGPLAALVLRALAWHAGQDRPSGPAGPAGGADAEALWAGSGVVVDELASTVLTLGLPAARSGATGAALAAWGAAGQPVVLTFRQLRLDPPSWRPAPPGAAVRRCTTSAQLLALADAARTGGEVVPAVVVGAPPSVAARAVLRGLQDAGWLLAPAADAAGAPPPAAVRHAGAK